jgi:hypothetical protein
MGKLAEKENRMCCSGGKHYKYLLGLVTGQLVKSHRV